MKATHSERWLEGVRAFHDILRDDQPTPKEVERQERDRTM
jgi:hypothetical protein